MDGFSVVTERDLDFKGHKKEGLNKIASYPATMIPEMQEGIIKDLIKNDSGIRNLLDPFHGSGISLVDGLSLGLNVYGIDINPLAHLMTKVKLTPLKHDHLKKYYREIKSKLESSDFVFPIHHFIKDEKWFRSDIQESLSKIRQAIVEIENQDIRDFFWFSLLNVIRDFSNTRSDTFKLYQKKDEMIEQIKNRVVEVFLNNALTAIDFVPEKKSYESHLFLGNTRKVLNGFPKDFFDLVVTSPPYGDNGTTVPYGQYSMLPIMWIPKEDLGINQENQFLIENYSSIDSNSLGGRQSKFKSLPENQTAIDFINEISEPKKAKVISFIDDYLDSFDAVIDSVKENKYMVLTLGNRRVDNHLMPLTAITKEFFVKKGMKLLSTQKRRILNKRMPSKLSRVNNKAVESMNVEYVQIYQKG